jgi:hypothetical protein
MTAAFPNNEPVDDLENQNIEIKFKFEDFNSLIFAMDNNNKEGDLYYAEI